jgi:hypothetical protein
MGFSLASDFVFHSSPDYDIPDTALRRASVIVPDTLGTFFKKKISPTQTGRES